MCGRYGRFSRKKRIEQILGTTIDGPDDLGARYNICPGLPDWVLRKPDEGAKPRFDSLLWGLLASGAKNPQAARRPINARAESVAQKPMFQNLLRARRCAVAVDGYYEWRTTSRGKVPFWFHLTSEEPFFLAGLWDCWHEGRPDAVPSYALMTTAPNELTAKVHDRMPVLLNAGDVARWLDPALKEVEVTDLLGPYPAAAMACRPVSKRVSNPDSEGPELIALDDSTPELWK